MYAAARLFAIRSFSFQYYGFEQPIFFTPAFRAGVKIPEKTIKVQT